MPPWYLLCTSLVSPESSQDSREHFVKIWKTRPAPGGASSVVFGDELSQAFEQEMASAADASARLMLMPESQLKRSGSNPLQSEVNSIIHPNFAAVQNVAKPVAQLDAHSVSNTTK